MRTVRMSSEPFAPRQRVLRWRGAFVALPVLVALVALVVISPARAASNSPTRAAVTSPAGAVGITVEVTALEPFVSAPIASCPVSVASGANGVAALEAAKASGCIESYETSDSQFGRFLECINGICGTDATYWRMALDDEITPFGLDGYEAGEGDTLTFSYTVWAGCLVDPALC